MEDISKKIKKMQKNRHALEGDFISFKLFDLNRYLYKFKPEVVIEFGAGYSSIVINEYIKKNPRAKAYSIVESQYYLNIVKRMVSNKRMTLIRAPKIKSIKDTNNIVFYSKKYLNKINITKKQKMLIYVDGPSTEIIQKYPTLKKSVCIDALHFIKSKHNLQAILFDCRFDSVKFFKENNFMRPFKSNLHFGAIKKLFFDFKTIFLGITQFFINSQNLISS